MASTPQPDWSALKAMSISDRLDAIKKGQIDPSGLTLYKFHMIPHIEATEPWAQAALSAGARWHKLADDGDQKLYWARHTTNLMNGSLAPLEPLVLQNYLAGNYHVQSDKIGDDGNIGNVEPKPVTSATIEDTRHAALLDGTWTVPSEAIEHREISASPSKRRPNALIEHKEKKSPKPFSLDKNMSHQDLFQLIQYTLTLDSDDETSQLLQFIGGRFAVDGRSLYYYHAHNNPVWSPFPRWHQVSLEEKHYWKSATNNMLVAFGKGQTNGLEYLRVGGRYSKYQKRPKIKNESEVSQHHLSADQDDIKRELTRIDRTVEGSRREALLRGLDRMFAKNGYSLFVFHVGAYVDRMEPQAAAEVSSPAELWKSLSELEMSYWKISTVKLSSALARGLSNGLDHLKTDCSTRRSQQNEEKIRTAIDMYSKDGNAAPCLPETLSPPAVQAPRETPVQAASQATQTSFKFVRRHLMAPRAPERQMSTRYDTPILDLFCGSVVDMCADQLISTAMGFMANLIDENPKMTLQVRYNGARIDYRPSATGVCSVLARLQAATYRGVTVRNAHHDCASLHQRFEWTVRPLVIANQELPCFAQLGIAFGEEAQRCSLDCRSYVDWLSLDGLEPLEIDKKDEIIAAVVDQVRVRVAKAHPNHFLLAANEGELPTGKSWSACVRKYRNWGMPNASSASSGRGSLPSRSAASSPTPQSSSASSASSSMGLASSLNLCFPTPYLNSEEYKDLIEQKLYAFSLSGQDLLAE